MLGKFLIFYAAILLIGDINAALLCEIDLSTPPNTCNNYSYTSYADFARLYNCSGGSSVTEFELWAACSPDVGSGSVNNPIVETPSVVLPASNAAGKYCYCQIKSINGSDVPSSPRWVIVTDRGSADACAHHCADSCVYYAMNYSGVLSALFQALQ